MARGNNPNETLDEIELHLKQAKLAFDRDALIAAEINKQAKLAFDRDALIAAEINKALSQVPRLREEISALKQTLEDRKIIEQAKGILMKRSGLTEKEAHSRLQKRSIDNGKKMVDNALLLIAAEIIMEEEI